MTAKFICRDCDATVFAIGIDAPPPSGRCSVCEWLAEFVPIPPNARRFSGDPWRPRRRDEIHPQDYAQPKPARDCSRRAMGIKVMSRVCRAARVRRRSTTTTEQTACA